MRGCEQSLWSLCSPRPPPCLGATRSLYSSTLTILCSQRFNVHSCRILLPGLATRSHFSSTWRALPQFVSLAACSPRVGVLACVCCPALLSATIIDLNNL